MKALVLVGGFGTRLRPITYEVPKQLIPLAGKPLLYHVLDLLPPETEEVVLASGYKAEVLEAYLRAHPLAWPTRCVPETEPLGTGGGMRNAAAGLSDPFLVLNSDVVADVRVSDLLAFHARSGGVGTMTLCEVEDPSPYGVAALGPGDRIERFVEKPSRASAPSRWINAGLSVWRRELLERVPLGHPVSWEREIVPGLLGEGVFGFRMHGYWEDAGTPERILNAQRLLFDGGRGGPGTLPTGATGTGPVFAGTGVRAERAILGPYVHLADRVEVGEGARVSDSILMDGATVGAGARVSGSILGPGTRVAAGEEVLQKVLGHAAPA
ncbi:MAG: sugar phosphate nucleotidyltransferase [Thermoplasmata archaeon]